MSIKILRFSQMLGSLGLALLLTLGVPWQALAATITVTTTIDELNPNGVCSLREAIVNANSNSNTYTECGAGEVGMDVINIPTGVYTLTITGANENFNMTGDLDVVTDTAGILLNGTGVSSATVVIVGRGDRVLHSSNGVAVQLQNLTMRGGIINLNGGGAWFGGVTYLTNTTFISNSAQGLGGAAYFNDSSTANVTGGVFSGNRATGNGGGVWFGSVTTMINTTFSNNTTSGSGGGARFRVTAWLTNTLFSSNTAEIDGGGARFIGAAYLTGTTFVNNLANTNDAGGAYFNSAAQVTGSVFLGNRAKTKGGGARFNADAWVNGATFSGNHADLDGGGAAFKGLTQLLNSNFVNNSSDNDGGAVNINANGLPVVFTRAQFEGNVAGNEGGAVYAYNAELTLTANRFVHNTATNSGGAIYYGQTVGQVDNSLFAHNVSVNGGARDIGLGGGSPSVIMARHNTFVAAGTGVAVWASLDNNGDAITLTNSIFQGYSPALQVGPFDGVIQAEGVLWDNVPTQTAGAGISLAAAYVGAAAFYDTTNYRLTTNSAAVDRGVNAGVTVDYFGAARPQGAGYDMGYAEGAIERAVGGVAQVIDTNVSLYKVQNLIKAWGIFGATMLLLMAGWLVWRKD